MPGQIVGVDAGVLERTPGHAQRDPLLGIHGDRLAPRDAEELRIEGGGAAEESAEVVDGLESVSA